MSLKRIVALDYGASWVGVAHTDPMQMFVQPYTTWKNFEFFKQLDEYLKKFDVEIIIIGYPITMKGKESEQTKIIIDIYEKIKNQYPTIKCILHDERLTSQHAQKIKKENNKSAHSEHSVAASILLQSYLANKIFMN